MKRNDTGDFCVLYVEPNDDKAALFNAIGGQKKPVVIMLAQQQPRVFQRPEDYTALKHLKRQLNMPIVFVIPSSEHLAQLAARNGFPVYSSIDALADALTAGQLVRHRTLSKPTTAPFGSGVYANTPTPKKTIPLPLMEEESVFKRSIPLQPSSPSLTAASPVLRVKRYDRVTRFLVVLTTVALVIAGLGTFLVLFYKLPTDVTATSTPPAVVGHIAFLSSEQLSENSSQGIADQLLIDLTNVPDPAPHKSYYAWLLGDKNQSDPKAIFLGALPVNKGVAHMFYQGDAGHSNLLLVASRFLITEEDATIPPIAPSPDLSTWRYYGEFSQVPIDSPDNTSHYSYLDHLRHLLASDPTLDKMQLPGGLDNWFYRNTSKILEWTGSMREQWEDSKDAGFVRRQAVRTLAYIDGASFVRQDVPANIPLNVSERLAGVGLLGVDGSTQEPPSYLAHIVHHLNGLLEADGPTSAQRKDVASIVTAMNNIQFWLTQVRHDAQQILKMTDQQLRQPATLSLINDMIDNANHAYVGQADPITGEMREGVVWVHQQIQALAILEIKTFTSHASIQMMPDTKHLAALRQVLS